MNKITLIICALLLTIGTLHSQPVREDNGASFRDWLGGTDQPSFQLLDPSKFSLQHSVSFGASLGGGTSLMQSIYTARIGYQISNPLSLTFLLGMQNNRFGGNGISNMSMTAPFGGVMLDYRPSKNVYFHMSILQAPRQTWQDVNNSSMNSTSEGNSPNR